MYRTSIVPDMYRKIREEQLERWWQHRGDKVGTMSGRSAGPAQTCKAVFIGNLPFDVDERNLRSMFAMIAPLANFRLVTDRESGKTKGFAFAEYYDIESAIRAIQIMDYVVFQGRELRVKFAETASNRGGVSPIPPAVPKRFPPGVDVTKGYVADVNVEGALSRISVTDKLQFVRELKNMMKQNPDRIRSVLIQNQVLAQATLQALVDMRLCQIPVPQYVRSSATAPESGASSAGNAGGNAGPSAQEIQQQLMQLTPEQFNALDPQMQQQVIDLKKQMGI